jgi:hypothetical protein
MKPILIALIVIFASCSENDPEPQVSCSQLKTEIEVANKAILDHQAKGNGGNQAAWEVELKRLMEVKADKSNEYSKRAC